MVEGIASICLEKAAIRERARPTLEALRRGTDPLSNKRRRGSIRCIVVGGMPLDDLKRKTVVVIHRLEPK